MGYPLYYYEKKRKKKKNKTNDLKQKPVKQRKKPKEGKIKSQPVMKDISMKEDIPHKNHIKENHIFNPVPIAPLILPKPPTELLNLPREVTICKSIDTLPKVVNVNIQKLSDVNTPKLSDVITPKPPEHLAISKVHSYAKNTPHEILPLPVQFPFSLS